MPRLAECIQSAPIADLSALSPPRADRLRGERLPAREFPPCSKRYIGGRFAPESRPVWDMQMTRKVARAAAAVGGRGSSRAGDDSLDPVATTYSDRLAESRNDLQH